MCIGRHFAVQGKLRESPFLFFFFSLGPEELIWRRVVRNEIDNSGDLYEFLDAYC